MTGRHVELVNQTLIGSKCGHGNRFDHRARIQKSRPMIEAFVLRAGPRAKAR